jgi:hypothetical protein
MSFSNQDGVGIGGRITVNVNIKCDVKNLSESML